jgi:hypothetical protein
MDPPAGNSQSFGDIWQFPTKILWPGAFGNLLVSWIGLAILASSASSDCVE